MVALCNNILVKPKHAQKNTADLAIKLRTYVLEVDRAKTKEHILQNPVAYKTTLQCQ